MDTTPIYQLRPADVYAYLESAPHGLTSDEAAQRLALFGPNLLSEQRQPPLWRKFLADSTHLMALLLWAAGLAALLFGQWMLGLAIFVLVLVNAAFSLWRTYRVEQAMAALRLLLPEYTRLLRDGQEVSLPSSQVTPGDVLVLAEGDNIPADARVVEEYGLRTNNATLTGDALPARKTADASLRQELSEVERPNLVFAGTTVAAGTGLAVVYATGMLTQFGRIAHLTQAVEESPTPLQVEMTALTRRISLVAIGAGLLAGLAAALEPAVEASWPEVLLLSLGVIVALIPEGLPATQTLALALAGQRLALKGVLVKKLAVLETLGTLSTICTDKSGTLTQNQMTVREVWTAGQAFQVSGVGYNPAGGFSPEPAGQPSEADLHRLLAAALLCNNARLNPPGPGHPQWTTLGDQTEAAMRVSALKGGLVEAQVGQQLPRVHELPFDARRKRMTTIHQGLEPGGERLACVKGAPREVLQLCSTIQVNGKPVPLDNSMRRAIEAAVDEYARRALRVLAVAERRLPAGMRSYSPESVEQGLTFLGLMAMHDPPRPEVSEAIATLRQAGIRLVMITGDYGLTALSLAQRIGMLAAPEALIVTGAELEALNDQQIQALLEREVIFARMAPEHKLRMVAALQARGEVVAVTGDGVNDAPALRKADVGIAMGMTGTDVAKEAADVILTNDNFATVVDAIREGRALYDNLRKFSAYIFSSNMAAVAPFLLTALTHLPLALRVAQILAIDLGTDMLPGLGLGSEKPEPDILQRPPRRRAQAVVERGLLRRAFLWLGAIESLLCFSGFFLVYALAGRLEDLTAGALALPPAALSFPPLAVLAGELSSLDENQVYWLAVTVYYAGVVSAQVGNAFACRTEINRSRLLGWTSNRFLLGSIAVSILLLLALIYTPLGRPLAFTPVPGLLWLWLAPYGLVLYGLEWIRKALFRQALRKKAKTAAAVRPESG